MKYLILVTILLTGCQNKEMTAPLDKFSEPECKYSCYKECAASNDACDRYCHRVSLLKNDLLLERSKTAKEKIS